MKQKSKNVNTFNDDEDVTSPVRDASGVNGSGSGSKSDTPLTQPRSADVHALTAMSRHHGDTPLGNRFLNIAQKLKARAECQDPGRAAAIERNMLREIAEIATLQSGADPR
jgi:hypothetical protein